MPPRSSELANLLRSAWPASEQRCWKRSSTSLKLSSSVALRSAAPLVAVASRTTNAPSARMRSTWTSRSGPK